MRGRCGSLQGQYFIFGCPVPVKVRTNIRATNEQTYRETHREAPYNGGESPLAGAFVAKTHLWTWLVCEEVPHSQETKPFEFLAGRVILSRVLSRVYFQ